MIESTSDLARSTVNRLSGIDRGLLLCGVVGSVLFTATWFIEGLTRPGYDAWRQPISALSLGPGGWIQAANFIVFGLLVGCSAFGWRAVLTPGIGATAIPLLKGITALGLIVDGIFSQDPANGYPSGANVSAVVTLHATIHLVGAVVAITALAAACFVFAWRFTREPYWRFWPVCAAATGVLTIVFIAAFGSATTNGPAGLFERLATDIQGLFTVVVIARVLTGTSPLAASTVGHGWGPRSESTIHSCYGHLQ